MDIMVLDCLRLGLGWTMVIVGFIGLYPHGKILIIDGVWKPRPVVFFSALLGFGIGLLAG